MKVEIVTDLSKMVCVKVNKQTVKALYPGIDPRMNEIKGYGED